MGDPIRIAGRDVDLSGRIYKTSTVIASPSANAETVVATTPAVDATLGYSLAIVFAEIAYTIGTSGVSCKVNIRQGTSTSGTLLYSTGAQTGGHNTATQLVADSAGAFDTSPSAQYSVTLTIGSGAAASTVSAVQLVAIYF